MTESKFAMLGRMALACGVLVTPPGSAADAAFVLSSPDIQDGTRVPATFVSKESGCHGNNVSPALEWRGAPAGTKSFAITMFDRDEHGTPSGWWHWVVYDIPASVTRLPRGAGGVKSKALPPGAREGRTDDAHDGYGGPCPDVGNPAHRYVISVYALKIAKLPVPSSASGANVTYTAREYTLGTATLVPVYGREIKQ